MEKKTENAIDIIFSLENRFSKIETMLKMLDDKMNAILRIVGDPEKKMKEKVFMKGEIVKVEVKPEVTSSAPESIYSIDADEVMEISSKAPKISRSDAVAYVSALQIKNEAPQLQNTFVTPIPKETTTSSPIKMDKVTVDPFNVGDKQEKITCIVRGKYDSRHGNVSNVGICIKDSNDKIVKNTKTNGTGDWLALLSTGEYVVEFMRFSQPPIVKTISIMPGKKEMEILI